MEHANIASCVEEFNGLDVEFKDLEEIHKQYLQKLDDLHAFQKKCLAGINHQRYRMKVISKSLGKITKKNSSEDDLKQKAKLDKDMIKRQMKFRDMEEYLPHQSGRYLRIILGSVNVSFLNKNDRYNYKDEYEKFKLIITFIAFLLSFTNLVFLSYRFLDLAFLFLLVWYYCTLTIRESILKVNGSKIKGWWRTHHFLSTVASGVLLIWPDGDCYQQFRKQFLIFNCYIAVIQFLQFRYQSGCLYRLKALGERHNMDITIAWVPLWLAAAHGIETMFILFIFKWIANIPRRCTKKHTKFQKGVSFINLLFKFIKFPVSCALQRYRPRHPFAPNFLKFISRAYATAGLLTKGFHSWMWRGLSFLMPLLYIGYLFQLYNGYTLYVLSSHPSCKEWQIPVLSVLFFVLFLGNTFTTSMVIPQKLKIKTMLKYRFSHFMKMKNGFRNSEATESKTGEKLDEQKEKSI